MPPLPSGMGSGPASAAASATSAAAAVPLSPAQRDAVEQMESVMDYIESITQALARRTRSMPPPERLVSFRASITPRCVTVSAQESGDGSSDPQHISFLSKLHEASSALLSWFSKLEYTKLAQQVSMEDLERETLGACVSVLSLVESVERKFSTHEEAAVRDAFVKRRKAVYECRELMDMLTKTTQQIVLLRRAVAEQDLFRARELLEDHKSTVKRSARGSSSASSSRYQEEMMKGPFFEWLEQRWFPAMRSWRRIVLDARQRAAAGDVQGAIARSQQEALSIPALQEILRPGETLSDLLQQQIEKPILELGKTFDKKKAVMDGLREAMECPTITELAKAIQAARDFSRVKSGSQQWESADDAVMAEAQQLLLDLQQAESVLRALQLAQQVQSDVCGQFVAVHKANELIHRLHLVENPSTAQRIVRSCRAVVVKLNETGSTAGSSSSQVASAAGSGVKSSCSPRSTPPPGPSSSAHDIARLLELLPSTVSMPDLCLVHMPSKVWTAEHIAAYQDVCKLLVEAYGREQVRRELEKLLDDGTSSARSSQHPPLGSARTPTATTSAVGGPSDVGGTHHVGALDMASANSSRHSSVAGDSLNSPRAHSGKHGGAAIRVDELQRKLQMAEEMGLSGPLVEQAKASLRRLQTLRLKVHFEAQTRLVPIPDAANTSFDTIYNTLYEYCRAQAITSTIVPGQRLRIRYEDHEGDYISIVNEDDWLIMLSDLVEGGALGGARISLYCDFLLLPSAHSMASPPETVAGSPMAGAGQGSAADGDGRGGNATNRNGVGKAGDPLDAEDQLPDDSVSTMPERRKAASPPAAEAGKPTTPTATVKKTQQVAGRSVSPAKNLKSKTSTTGGSTAPSSAPGTTTTIAALLAKANAAKRRSGAAAAAAAGGGTTKGSTPTKPPTPPLAPSSGSTVEANAEQALEDLPPWQRCVIRPATNNAARLRQQVTHRSRSYGARRAAAESPSRRDDVSSVAASSATLQTTTSTAKPGNPSGGTLAPGPASRKFGRLASAPWVSDHRYTDAAAAPSGAMRAVSPGKARVRSRRGSGDRVDGSSPNSSSTSGKHALTLENLIRAQTATHVPTDSTSAGASMRQPTPPPPAAPQNVASNDARGNAGDGLASAGMVGTSSVVHLNMANARRWQDEEGLDLDIQTMVSVSTYLPRSALPPRLPLAPTPPVVTSPNASAGGSATGSTAPRNMFTTTNCCRSGGNGSASGLPKPVERRWNSDDLNLDEIRTVFSDVSGQVDSMKAPRSPVNVGAGRPDGQAVSPDAAIRAARVRPGRQITPQRAPSPLKAVSASGGGGLNDSGAEMAGLPPSPKPPPAVSEAEEKYRCHRSQEEILEEMRKLQRENAKMKDGRRR